MTFRDICVEALRRLGMNDEEIQARLAEADHNVIAVTGQEAKLVDVELGLSPEQFEQAVQEMVHTGRFLLSNPDEVERRIEQATKQFKTGNN